jgi:soluble P-type ATPase
MIQIQIPGYGELRLRHLVLDYNGTLAIDGELISTVPERLREISRSLEIHILTADTFGTVRSQTGGLPVTVTVLGEADQAGKKASFIEQLGAEGCAAIGNGYNDHLMLRAARLGIAVIQGEGAAQATIAAADLVFTSIGDALDSLLHTGRLAASLRR